MITNAAIIKHARSDKTCGRARRAVFRPVAPAAFHAGLAESLSELSELLASDTALYGHGYGPAELRGLMSHRRLPSFVRRDALSSQLQRIIDLADAGLRRRGFGEEAFIAPLRSRADTLASPAREHVERIERGETIESVADDYGRL